MVKLELLSPNLIVALQTMLTNQRLVKFLKYDSKTPLAEATVTDTQSLMFTKLFPYPFDQFATVNSSSQVHVYFASGTFSDRVVEHGVLYFDVLVAKSLWLIDTGDPKIRPYEIVSEIVNTFNDQSISTLGKVSFMNFRHLAVNEQFDAIQLVAKVTSFSS